QKGAYSTSPSNSGVSMNAVYRRTSNVVPARVKVPIVVPSPGRWPLGGRRTLSHSKQRVVESNALDTVYAEELFDVTWPHAPHRARAACSRQGGQVSSCLLCAYSS